MIKGGDKERASVYGAALSTDDGKRVLEDLESLFVGRTVYGIDGKNLNDLQLAYKEGQRYVVTWMKTFIALAKDPNFGKNEVKEDGEAG